MAEHFIGRKVELADLKRFTKKNSASMIVVRGRRRIGKSRLVEEFAKDRTFYSFSGIFPTKDTTAQSERNVFARQLNTQTGLPEIMADDWSKLFLLLSERLKTGKIVLLFDEISWMGSKDSNFLGQIKHAWDVLFKKNPQLIFVICGSASSWIEKNILSSTGFLGRISYTLTLKEMPLYECALFWGSQSKNSSAYEKLKILSVTGGIPKYLEEIDFKLSAEATIKKLCFENGGFLVDEFDNIFSDLFLRNSAAYRDIVRALISGAKEPGEICKDLGIEQTGRFGEYLHELELSGFIKRDYTWHLSNGQDSKLSKYRLSDNYVRFYLKYIENYRTKIARDSFAIKSLDSLPELYPIMGLQFENLVLNNRKEIHQALGLRAEDIVSENPFFQRATKHQPGCQIDYMIQTTFNILYVCEIKFSKNSIGSSVIKEVEQKIDRLVRPRSYSIRSVLIHVNGVDSKVSDQNFFTEIIDFGQLLK